MFEFIRQNPYLALIVLAVVLLFVLHKKGMLEGFSTCYNNKIVILKDAQGGMNEGIVEFVDNKGKLYISINANLPYHKAGVFGTTVSNYVAYLVNPKQKDLPPVAIGYLLRYGDRRYRLKNALLGNYNNYSDIIVVRKIVNEKYPDVVVLEGKV